MTAVETVELHARYHALAPLWWDDARRAPPGQWVRDAPRAGHVACSARAADPRAR